MSHPATSLERNGTIAFVPPRYGPEVVGGAEAVFADMAHGLAARGWDVEVLTTCARDHYTWANEYPAGETTARGVVVRRFPTVMDTPGKLRDRLGHALLRGEGLTRLEQQLWMNDSLRVPDLWHHVLDHGDTYRAIVLGPYMFWTTFAVSQIHPARTVIVPCLHREPAATLDLYKPMFQGSRGVLFLTDPERDLARELYRLPERHAVVGAGVDLPRAHDPERFRRTFGIEGEYLYFGGRREWAKGWFDLVEAVAEARARGCPLRLVTSGAGDVTVPGVDLGDGLIDVGFLDDDLRDGAMAGAAAYVQPSALESFSLTILEAWGAGTPVIANAESEVVSWHVERSGAGVLYRGARELVEAISVVGQDPGGFRRLANGARSYVEQHYAPDRVLDAVEHHVAEWTAV